MRYALCLEYQGENYKGWQRQNHAPSIQAALEKALSTVLDHDVEVICAGRTDAGVHATNQVIHFDTHQVRPLKAFTLGVNANLPQEIAVKWAKPVSDEFHARFSASARRYRYLIYNNRLRPAIFHTGITHEYRPLDVDAMHIAAQCLVGEHDFSSFRASLCQSKTPFRQIHDVSLKRFGNFVMLDIRANAFLHHMVRNITGSLLEIGCSAKPVEWMRELLEAKDRKLAAATAKPNGLYLTQVYYEEKFALPEQSPGPLFVDLTARI